MSIFRKLRTFVGILSKDPSLAWEVLQLKAERRFGIPLHFLSARRWRTYRFEQRHTRPLSPSLTAYGNYYLAADRLSERPVIFSAGVGQEISFDRALVEKHPVELFLFDPTPATKRFIETQDLPTNVRFEASAVADFDGELELFIDDIADDFDSAASISIYNRGAAKGFKVPCRRVKTLMAEHEVDHLDVLKLDIEGAAIRVLNDTLNEGILPIQIAAEFERPDRMATLPAYFREVEALLDRLKAHGYSVYRTRDTEKGCQVEFVAVRDASAALPA